MVAGTLWVEICNTVTCLGPNVVKHRGPLDVSFRLGQGPSPVKDYKVPILLLTAVNKVDNTIASFEHLLHCKHRIVGSEANKLLWFSMCKITKTAAPGTHPEHTRVARRPLH